MKLIYLICNFLFFLSATAQKLSTTNNIYLFDSLEDQYLYKIESKVDNSFSNDSYYLLIARAQRGFFAFGTNKKINTLQKDTTILKYQRTLLGRSQIDSLKIFEQKLITRNSPNCDTPRQYFILSNQTKNQNYLIKQSADWNPIDELVLILFRQRN
jgi:hypothetical protein